MTSSPSSVFFIFLLLTILLTVSSDLEEDKKALRNFMDKVGKESKIIWGNETDTCEWTGVTCDSHNLSVIYVILPLARLVGEIPPDSLGKITSLHVLYLHHNKLSGQFPHDFDNLTKLKKFNVSNNNFIGPIPKILTKFPVAAFSGNIYLCSNDTSLPPCNDTVISQQSQSQVNKKEEKLCTPAIVVIAVGSALILLLLLSYLRKERSEAMKEKNAPGVATKAAKVAAAAKGFEKVD